MLEIKTTEALKSFCETCAKQDYVTVDTEFLREKTYFSKLCLIQVAFDGDGETDAALVDVLAEGIDLAPLYALFDDESVIKVFHAARQDLEIFYHEAGRLPKPFFDTQVAAMVCGFGEQVGYERLVRSICNSELDKSSRFTDWSNRPLSDKQKRYAIGDVTPGQALAHVASAEGILCVEKIAGMHVEPIDYGNIPGCTYCAPEVASVGLTEQKAIEEGYEIKVGKFPFSASGKAQASGHADGFVKVIFDAKYGEWLGCHMIGAGVTDMIAEAVVARKLETTGHEILKAVHPHPTMSEAVMEAVAAAYDEVIHL